MNFCYFSQNLSGINILGYLFSNIKLMLAMSAPSRNNALQTKNVFIFILRCFQLDLSPEG